MVFPKLRRNIWRFNWIITNLIYLRTHNLKILIFFLNYVVCLLKQRSQWFILLLIGWFVFSWCFKFLIQQQIVFFSKTKLLKTLLRNKNGARISKQHNGFVHWKRYVYDIDLEHITDIFDFLKNQKSRLNSIHLIYLFFYIYKLCFFLFMHTLFFCLFCN